MNFKDLVACAHRELALRRRVYPGLVARGKMSHAKAEHEIEAIASILELLNGMRIFAREGSGEEVGD